MSVNIKIEIVAGVEGNSCYINGRRVCGNKPWGGGTVIYKGETVIESIMQAIGVDCKDKLQSSWHSVADGDIPRANKNCIFHYLGRMSKGFMRGDKSIFLEDDLILSPNIREIDYWMEIPELPK